MEKKKRGPKPMDESYLMASLAERQITWVMEMIEKDGYTVRQLAIFLGIHRQTLYNRINSFVGITTLTPPNYLLVNKDNKIKLDPLLLDTDEPSDEVIEGS